MQDDRVAAIVQTIQDVEQSPLSVNHYFKTHATPFGRAQYYLYKKTLEERGTQGVYDQRSQGNHTKVTQEVKSVMTGLLESHRSMPSSQVQQALLSQYGIVLSTRRMNTCRQEHALRGLGGSFQESGGAEVVIALVLASGFIETLTDAISQHVQKQGASKRFRTSLSMPKDHPDLRSSGQFTADYNKVPAVSGTRFQSFDDTCHKTRWASMRIFSRSKASLKRYSLALFALPVVTVNGRVRSVDNPRGNA